MDGSDDEVEGRQYAIGIVKGTVVEDIGFDAFENDEGGQLPIQFIDQLVLGSDPVLFQAVGIEGALAVVADDQVLETLRNAGTGHLFERVGAVAPVAVAVNDPTNITRLNVGG